MISDKPLSIGGFRLSDGWCGPEPWGVWSIGRQCTLKFALAEAPSGPLRLAFYAMAAVSESFPTLFLRAYVNGRFVKALSIALGAPPPAVELNIPASIATGAKVFWITFEFSELMSPEQQAGAPDGRLLGLGVHSATLSLGDEEPACL